MDGMFIVALAALIVGMGTVTLYFFNRPLRDADGNMRRLSRDEDGFMAFLSGVSWVMLIVGGVFMTLASVSIIQTGQAGVVRVMGIVQTEVLEEGMNGVKPWATVTRKETRGFQIDQTGENALEVLTANGTRFTVELSVPVKLNPLAVVAVESRIEGGNWQSEVTSLQRGLVRNNVSGYKTFADFQVRRAAAVNGVSYGEELAGEIEDRVNRLFCDTYGICGVEVVDVGEVIIRKVNAPSAITSEAAALEAAQLAEQTERALNAVEAIRAERRKQEGIGYGNLFSFLPNGTELSASDAANFLRAAADKTRADAAAYMQRQLSESIADAMSKGQPLPSLIVTAGGNTPTPIFDPHQQ